MSDVVVVREASARVVVVDHDATVTVRGAGAQGPPGPPGPAGSGGFEHIQSTPASNWIITHNLGRRVQVSVFDSLGVLVYADVTHGSDDECTVTFSSPFAGSAVIS